MAQEKKSFWDWYWDWNRLPGTNPFWGTIRILVLLALSLAVGWTVSTVVAGQGDFFYALALVSILAAFGIFHFDAKGTEYVGPCSRQGENVVTDKDEKEILYRSEDGVFLSRKDPLIRGKKLVDLKEIAVIFQPLTVIIDSTSTPKIHEDLPQGGIRLKSKLPDRYATISYKGKVISRYRDMAQVFDGKHTALRVRATIGTLEDSETTLRLKAHFCGNIEEGLEDWVSQYLKNFCKLCKSIDSTESLGLILQDDLCKACEQAFGQDVCWMRASVEIISTEA